MDGGIRIKKLISLLLAFFILISVSSIGTAAEIIIQPGTSVIQNAVSNSAAGDVIILKPGTYYDNIIVTKPNLTIKSSSGNPGDTTIKARNSRADVFLLQADGIKINGLGISGATATRCSAINLSSCRYCSIENNKLTNNLRGINLLYAHWNTISKNMATSNTEYGIVLGNATANVISGNKVYSNARGIHIGNSDSNTLSSDTVQDNNVYGLYVCGRSDRNTIYDNYFSNTNMTIKNGVGNSYSTTKTAGTNIVGGQYIGGNYWAKPSGNGFSQTAVDKDGDGLSDSAYTNIEGSIYSDYLPLVTPGIPIPIPLVADFSSNTTSGNSPLNVAFTDKSTGSPTAWNWSFGDKTYSTTQNPVHTYLAKGNYAVSLKVTNDVGSNTTTKTNYIIVSTPTPTPIPAASFSSNVTAGNKPLTVAFTDTSSNSPTAWSWTFGDGATSNERNPTHKYSTEGTYTVALTVTNGAGQNTTIKSNFITVTPLVSPKPVASFSSNVTSGSVPLSVAFTDTSTNSPTSWNWDFGDGATSTTKNPTHRYSTAGSYKVVLTVTNAAGSNTTAKSNYITISASKTPVAAFSASPTSGNAPLSVTFTDASTNSPTAWKWTFGDGTTSTTKNPTHQYTTAGSYTVTLTATNAAGSNTATKSAYVLVTALTKPIAAFSASPISGTTPLSVVFTDKSTGSPTSWKWTFGDGTTSTTRNPTHAYTKAGSYTVVLTAANAAGSSTVTKSAYIKLAAPVRPVAAFSAYPTSGTAPLKVQFTDKSTGTPTSWKWAFGDGTYSTTRSPLHTYNSKGKFTVTLTVKNAAGSSYKTISGYVTVT